MFTFKEEFKVFDENYKPYGIFIESSSAHWHKGSRIADRGYAISCCGNRYFLDVGKVKEFEVELDYGFSVLSDVAAVSVVFGYNPDRHCGYELMAEWRKDGEILNVKLIKIVDERNTEVEVQTIKGVPFPQPNEDYKIKFCAKNDKVVIDLGNAVNFSFSVKLNYGNVGFSRPEFVGEVFFYRAEINVDLNVEEEPSVKVEVPMYNGGTMPLTMEYRQLRCGEKKFLKVVLDGGPQYRKNYKTYPLATDQYVAESFFIYKPYVLLNDKKYSLSNGEINTVDVEGFAWKEILMPMLNFSTLPLAFVFPIDNEDIKNLGFGYEDMHVSGEFSGQRGKSEFKWSVSGEYIGRTVFNDTFALKSPENKKAVQIIPDSVYQSEIVKDHYARNHYFAEDENVEFTVFAKTDKKYITYSAELQDVYGTHIKDVDVVDGKIFHTPLTCGVYRMVLNVFYGSELFKKIDTVFEVFDVTGKKCAPLESGLPFMYSMQNEQKYQDRDAYDPWNIGPVNGLEHFYACAAFTGYIAEEKRIWEVTKKFGRKWYVWLSKARTMLENDYRDHMDIIKNADYVYYPCDYEWGVLRSDFNDYRFWANMPKLRELLEEFLDSHDGYREVVGLSRGEPMTEKVVSALLTNYYREWYELVSEKKFEGFSKQNELFTSINPEWKRACYGPFNEYQTSNRSYTLCRMYGYKTDEALSDVLFTGFAQLEDYPGACAYSTYNGTFGVGSTLVNTPNIKIYPEQYSASRGGCIDGAVYFANPPIGARKQAPWFTVTHAREFVYNTPHITKYGYAYWNSYGFMRCIANDGSEDYFVREWKHVVEHKPKKNKKSTVFICDFPIEDDRYEMQYINNFNVRSSYNVSEEGASYLYGRTREAGLPNGVFTNWEMLESLTENDMDLLVIASTEKVNEKTLAKIRELYVKGVSLLATSRVDGLEDLFGVKYAPKTVKFYNVRANGKTESVYPYETVASYIPDGAQTVMTAEETPAIYKYGRTAMFNISCGSLGRFYFREDYDMGRESISDLLKEVSDELLLELSNPSAIAKGNGGITLFEDENGNEMMLVIDYSNYDSSKLYQSNDVTVSFNEKRYKEAVSVDGKPLRKLIGEDGKLDGIVVSLRKHESALVKLV